MSTSRERQQAAATPIENPDRGNRTWLIVIALIVVAGIPRFYELGSLGFYGDEETTAFPARALVETGSPKMPSGMAYYRALPLTILNAISAYFLGLEQELSYRVPAALLGTLTVPLLFLMARSLVGAPVALLAAIMLALSEWHIVTSREARMYAPFLLFYLGSALATMRWAATGHTRHLILAAALFMLSVSLHRLSVFGAAIALIPIAFVGWTRIAALRLFAVAALWAVLAEAYDRYVVLPAFFSPDPAQGEATNRLADAATGWIPDFVLAAPFRPLALVGFGAAIGLWMAARSWVPDRSDGYAFRAMAHYASAIIAGALMCVGQLYGAALAALIFLYVCPLPRRDLAGRIWPPLVALVTVFVLVVSAIVAKLGLSEGMKFPFVFPFPYPAFFLEMFPVVFLLFGFGVISSALRTPGPDHQVYGVLILAVIVPVAAIGSVSRWGGMRYLIETYPFLLLVVAGTLLVAVRQVGLRTNLWSEAAGLAVAILIVASGLLGGHGIPQAISAAAMNYGAPVNEYMLGYPFYPDHKSPGEFLRSSIAPSDILIAEDPLQQRWYAGRVDYWFRKADNVQRYIYSDATGVPRDIYVNSQPIENLAGVNVLVESNRNGAIWFITSGETQLKRDYYLSSDQRRWLKALESHCESAFTGMDGVTKVYCVSCCEALDRLAVD